MKTLNYLSNLHMNTYVHIYNIYVSTLEQTLFLNYLRVSFPKYKRTHAESTKS